MEKYTNSDIAKTLRENNPTMRGFDSNHLSDDFIAEETIKQNPELSNYQTDKTILEQIEDSVQGVGIEIAKSFNKFLDVAEISEDRTQSLVFANIVDRGGYRDRVKLQGADATKDYGAALLVIVIFFSLVFLVFSKFIKVLTKNNTSLKDGAKNKEVKNEDEKENKNSTLKVVLLMLSFTAPFLLMKSLGLGALLFVLPYFIYWLANKFSIWYIRNKTSEKTLTSILVWSNVVTWLLPPLGLFTGIAAIKISEAYPEKKDTYRAVAFVCLTICIINSIIGAYLGVMNN